MNEACGRLSELEDICGLPSNDDNLAEKVEMLEGRVEECASNRDHCTRLNSVEEQLTERDLEAMIRARIKGHYTYVLDSLQGLEQREARRQQSWSSRLM